MNITSPIDNKSQVRLVEKIPVERIKSLYTDLNVDKYFSNVEIIQIFECTKTGYKFYYPFDVRGDGEYYLAFSKLGKNYYLRNKWEFEEVIKLLKGTETLLEIGCGDGNFLRLLRPYVKAAVGLEINPDAKDINNFENANVLLETIEEHCRKNKSKYDVICAFQVLEHISEIYQFMTDTIKCLKSNGILAFSVPNNDGFIRHTKGFNRHNLPPHHMGLWNKQSLIKLGKEFDLDFQYVKFEPLKRYVYDLFHESIVQRAYKLHWRIGCLLRKIPKKVIFTLYGLLGPFINGHSILVIYKYYRK